MKNANNQNFFNFVGSLKKGLRNRVMQYELKRRGYKDPYDNSKCLKYIVFNRFASEIIKIVKSSQEYINTKIIYEDINELQRVQFTDAEVQTDVQLDKIEDQKKIKSLVFIISIISNNIINFEASFRCQFC